MPTTNRPECRSAPGVSLELATARARSIEALTYEPGIHDSRGTSEPIMGKATIRFSTRDVTQPLVLDFSPDADHITSITAGGRPSHFRLVKDHIVIPNSELASEDNSIEIAFRAGDGSLNRSPDFMYTLFVPARRPSCLSVFRSAHLKAAFCPRIERACRLAKPLRTGPRRFMKPAGDRVRIRYAETQPIRRIYSHLPPASFRSRAQNANGRWYRMLHRENGREKSGAQQEGNFSIFHASSLEWLEKYTAIPYRFGKFDFVLIPSFQFGGMETSRRDLL